MCWTGALKGGLLWNGENKHWGYRIFVGGMFGCMYTIGKEVFRMGERQDIFKTLDAVVNLIREKQDDEHSLSQVVDKVGIGYINQQVFGGTKEH